jgi:hypothetical protein
MEVPAVPLLLTCGPAVLSTFALLKSLRDYKRGEIRTIPLGMIFGAWLITAYAAYIFVLYTVRPSPNLPPWKDPETLDLGLLFLLAPLGFVFTILARLRGASKWVVVPLAVGLLVLFVVGLLEGASV